MLPNMVYYCPECNTTLSSDKNVGIPKKECVVTGCGGIYEYMTQHEASLRKQDKECGLLSYQLQCNHCEFMKSGFVPEVLVSFMSIPHIKQTGHSVNATFYDSDGEYRASGTFDNKVKSDSTDDVATEYGWFIRKYLFIKCLFGKIIKKYR